MKSTLRIAALNLLVVGPIALAQTPPSVAESTPMLQQLNREVQQVYREARSGLVLVEMPVPNWIAQGFLEENPLSKYKDLDPELRQRLVRESQARLNRLDAKIVPGGESTTRPAEQSELPQHIRGTVIVLGTILDDKGTVLIPLYLEKQTAGDRAIQTMCGSELGSAKFLGSDKQMNLTVFRLEKPPAKVPQFSNGSPGKGELTLTISPDGSNADLHVWSGGRTEHGIIVKSDGEIAGFCRAGQFMSVATALPIVKQIVETGNVKRAFMGVRIAEVFADDPARQSNPALKDRPAVKIELVLKDTPADKAGLKENDLILSLAGEPVGELSTFASKLASREGKTDLRILRGSEEMTIAVDLVAK